MGVGERIQAAREQKTFSRPKLAELLGVKPNTIWRWENGERQPSDDDKHRLAHTLGVSIAYLMGEDPAPPKPQKHVDQNGLPLSTGNSFKRGTLRLLGALPFGLGWFMAAFNQEARTMHDLVADTHVVLRVRATRIFH